VRGSTTGRTNIAGFDACIGRGVAALRAIGCNQKYVNYWLFTQRQQLYEMGDGTTTFNNITADTLQAIKIVLPNETTQKAVVDRLDVEVDTLQRLTASLEYMTEYVNDMFDQLWGKNE
jgi:type I restriction enzyme S subunit